MPASLMGDRIYRTRIVEIKVETAQGIPLSRIAVECGIDRKTARKLRDATSDPNGPITRARQSRFVEYTEYVRERLKAGVPIAQIVRALSSAARIRPFLTLAVTAWIFHSGLLHPGTAFSWLGHDGVATIMTLLASVEFTT